jgi:hypothetical protein
MPRSVMLVCAVALAVGFALQVPAQAEEGGPVDLSLSLQYRPRFYANQGHDFTDGGEFNIIRHRARLGAGAVYKKKFGVYVEVQDVRTFGEETNTLGDFAADNFDLHQSYVSIMPLQQLTLRIGRQEIGYENHRLIGTVGWTEQARSFDGARARWDAASYYVDAFWARVADDFAGANAADVDLAALNVHADLGDWLSLGGLTVFDADSGTKRRRITIGAIATGGAGGLSYSAEGYYQFGSANGDVSYAAWLAAAHLRYGFGGRLAPFVELFGEAVSGDDDPADNDMTSFDTLYATNHKFYGEMDFFLNLPVHTGGRGLMDVGAQAGLSPLKKVGLKVTGHHFLGAADVGDDLGTFGTEVDVRIDWKPYETFRLDLVYAAFFPGDIFKETLGDDVENYVYTTLDVTF